MRIKKLIPKGFTLIELMLVMFLIGILSIGGILTYRSISKRWRNAQRIKDIKTIQKAFEEYKGIHGEYKSITSMVAEMLPKGLPTDPKTDENYLIACERGQQKYCICALLEDQIGNAYGPATGLPYKCFFREGGNYFCAGQLQ